MLTFRGPRAASRTQTQRRTLEANQAASKRASTNNSLVRKTSATSKFSQQLAVRRYADDSKDLPVSPHVTIYKQSLPAITSITHRVAGIALFGGSSR